MQTLTFLLTVSLCSFWSYTVFGESTNIAAIGNTSTNIIPFLKREILTNDLSCVLQVTYDKELSSMHPPVCWVTVLNHTTNLIRGVVGPAPCLFAIELFDSNGKQIKKTNGGKKFGMPLSQEEINSWWPVQHGVSYRLPIFTSSPTTPFPGTGVANFNISDAFQIKEAGEYSLHLRMRLIQTKPDVSGQPNFSMIWLPEVIAKVQIRPEDIPPENILQNGQTNPPAK